MNSLSTNGNEISKTQKKNNYLTYNLHPATLENSNSFPLKAGDFTATSLLMLSLERGDGGGQLAVNEFGAWKAAQGKTPVSFALQPLSAAHLCSVHLLNVCAATPPRLQPCPPQYPITADAERLLPREMLSTKGYNNSQTSSAMQMIASQNIEAMKTNGVSLSPKDKRRPLRSLKVVRRDDTDLQFASCQSFRCC